MSNKKHCSFFVCLVFLVEGKPTTISNALSVHLTDVGPFSPGDMWSFGLALLSVLGRPQAGQKWWDTKLRKSAEVFSLKNAFSEQPFMSPRVSKNILELPGNGLNRWSSGFSLLHSFPVCRKTEGMNQGNKFSQFTASNKVSLLMKIFIEKTLVFFFFPFHALFMYLFKFQIWTNH